MIVTAPNLAGKNTRLTRGSKTFNYIVRARVKSPNRPITIFLIATMGEANEEQHRAIIEIQRYRSIEKLLLTTHPNPTLSPPPPEPLMHKFFTPPPRDGFPPIHQSHPTQVLDGYPIETLAHWLKEPGFKIIARIFDYPRKMYADHSLPNALVRESIKTIVSHALPNLPPPTCQTPPTRLRGTTTSSILVTLPSEKAQRALLRGRIWSSEWITFEALPTTHTTPPSVLFAITTFPTGDPSYPKNYIRTAWSDARNAGRIADALTRTDEKELTGNEVLSRLMPSLAAEPFPCPTGLGFSFVIHAHTWQKNVEHWANLKRVLLSLDYPPAPKLGQIHVTPLPYCSLCHSVTHPRPRCPFPKLPLWNGPV